MSKKVCIVNTSLVSLQDLKDLFAEICPDAEIFNIVDESLLPEVRANNGITNNIVCRMCAYFQMAVNAGADLIFNQCSSVGEAADIAARTVNVPVVKVDERMGREAVNIGPKISMVATLESTLGPSIRLVENTAKKMGREVTVKRCLVEGAFDVLFYQKNPEKHNQMVIDLEKRGGDRGRNPAGAGEHDAPAAPSAGSARARALQPAPRRNARQRGSGNPVNSRVFGV